MENHNHNLVQQLSESLDSLWRCGAYKKDAKKCAHCAKLWTTLESRFSGIVKMLEKEITNHVKDGSFS